MKIIIGVLSFVFSYAGFGQNNKSHVFNDTSLYFIQQADTLISVQLSTDELALAEELFIQAAEKFTKSREQYLDSLYPDRKNRNRSPLRIDINLYFFRLMPGLNKENQKIVWICGDCKDLFVSGKTKNPLYDKTWKREFIDGGIIADGGSCFVYLLINLTRKTREPLTMNGEG